LYGDSVKEEITLTPGKFFFPFSSYLQQITYLKYPPILYH